MPEPVKEKETTPAIDPLQKLLNDKVESFDLGVTDDRCIFKIDQSRDPRTYKMVTVGAHSCKNYGL